MILIISNSRDKHIPLVLHHLASEKVTCLFTDEIIDKTLFTLSPDQLIANIESESAFLQSASSIWYRKPKPIDAQTGETNIDQFIAREWQMFLRSLYVCLQKKFWVNPVPANTFTNAKLHQIQIAKKIGFIVPETIFTNDKQAALNFAKKHQTIALKVIDQVVVAADEDRYMYTKKLSYDNLMALDGFNLSPVIIQEYIPKKYEVRTTCIGEKIFSCRLDSQDNNDSKEDWRNGSIKSLKHTPIKLPDELENKIRKMLKYYNLQFAGIDFLVTPDNQHIFLEINPNGQWAWIEILTKIPISKAIADLLIKNGSH